MNYNDSLNWLNGFQQFGVKLGLDRIKHIVSELGDPQNNFKVIHIGGTNGKGSVCRFLESVLLASGYGVGVYTSPHLQRFSERIVVDGEEISKRDVVSLVKKVKPVVEKMTQDGDNPTYFEIATAIAFQYFSDRNVDFAVVEVGLGGRFDATNIVNPLVAVVTNVSLEHTNILGKNIQDVALEKSGIIKNNVPVVTAAQGKALKVIRKIAKEKNATLKVMDQSRWKRNNFSFDGQEFYVKGFLKDYQVKTSMLGKFQGENIGLSLATVEQLQMNGIYISDDSIVDGVGKAIVSGRMEMISREPWVLLDGAHNSKSMEMLANDLKNDFDYDRLIVVLGILSDKDIKSMLELIVPITDIIVVTKSSNSRACDPSIIKKMIEELGYKNEVVVKDKIGNAVAYARYVSKKNDLICITGSLFTVGETRDYLQKC